MQIEPELLHFTSPPPTPLLPLSPLAIRYKRGVGGQVGSTYYNLQLTARRKLHHTDNRNSQ